MPPKKVLAVLHRDPKLKRITHLPLAPLQKDRDIFQDLIRTIVFQQLSGKAGATIYGRFLDLFTRRQPTPRKILKLDIPTLRLAGLSNQKAGYIQNIARASLEQKFDRLDWQARSDEELMARLTAIKGVGQWTAQITLMFSLQRPDIFPLGDVSLQSAVKEIYALPHEGKDLLRAMEELSDCWAPYRSWAARYFWAWKDQII